MHDLVQAPSTLHDLWDSIDWSVIAGKAGTVATVVIIGLLARWVLCRAIDRLVHRAARGNVPGFIADTRAAEFLDNLKPANHARRQQRTETMGSLLKSITTGLILAVVVVTILSTFGIDIAPIIASAGIVGVALGFGAQNLVKDFLSGIFMILEDQYGVGDTVDLGEATGTVEAVSLRITRVRDVNGTVWYVRNGEILRVGNQSQNWARTVLDVTVSYDADLDAVQRILQEVATTTYENEQFHDVIIEAPEVWGVERFDKDGVVVRVVLKTAPAQQWLVARAMRQRIKAEFDRAGIKMPTTFPVATMHQEQG
jgi:small-conductance mechanosensitive channel